MRQFFFTVCIVLIAFSCGQSGKKGGMKTDTTTTQGSMETTTVSLTGADKDEHGCIGSAGYTWSVLKNDCIRIFEAGTRLNAAEAVTDKTTSAFAVFGTDNKKAELYIPGQAGAGLILEQGKSDSKKWDGQDWSLEKTAKGLVLKKAGIIQYAE